MHFVIRALSSLTRYSTSRPSLKTILYLLTVSQTNYSMAAHTEEDLCLLDRSRALAPSLKDGGNYKGQAGKIAVVGGSFEYTGAPYFSAISALKVGADLVHVICTKDAAIPIKCYSPELMVHPLLEDGKLEEIQDLMERMDVVVVGPGLGRNNETMKMVAKIIQHAKTLAKPMVIDADGLFVVGKNLNLLKNFNSPLILTPNRAELQRMVDQKIITKDATTRNLSLNVDLNENVTVLAKGMEDIIINKKGLTVLNNLGGSNRRCGGQGDILSGALAVFLNWSTKYKGDYAVETSCYAACKLVRETNQLAFEAKGRSATASDMIERIHEVFEQNFEMI